MLEARPGQLYLSRVRKGCDASCWVARYTLADIYGQSPALVQARELARRAGRPGDLAAQVSEGLL